MDLCEDCGVGEVYKTIHWEGGSFKTCLPCWGGAMLVSIAKECGWGMLTMGTAETVTLITLGDPVKIERHKRILARFGIESKIEEISETRAGPAAMG